MQELIPLGCGLLLGAVLGFVRPSIRLPVGAALAIMLGVLATVITGEFKLSWGYVLIDIPLVAIAAFAALVTVRHFALAARTST
jgi:xanthosine utilization system XapX-like protein